MIVVPQTTKTPIKVFFLKKKQKTITELQKVTYIE